MFQPIAIIGAAGQFPNSPNLETFWENVAGVRDCVSRFSDEELVAAGVAPEALASGQYVRAQGWLPDCAQFDPGFFGFSRREAEVTDPQLRRFLTNAWRALENAGYDPRAFAGVVGVFAGSGRNRYQLEHIPAHPDVAEAVGTYQVLSSNEKDFLATKVAYHLGLTGPAISVQTACSTSLVAVHLACRALQQGECNLALAGGASLCALRPEGYLFQSGMILSPDGRCRPFDRDAAGTVPSSGVGVVVLKPLDDALEDQDRILAVIRASFVNNDGAQKVGFTAPGVTGQANLIEETYRLAGFSPETVGYVEGHGTGTALGDPSEFEALTSAFRKFTNKTHFCSLGSVKANLGHADAAAGIAGLLKAALALDRKLLPGLPHFMEPHPRMGIKSSPFYFQKESRAWEGGAGAPRRAGVSSFGIGGTNVHVVLEEAPPRASAEGPGSRTVWPLLLSAADAEDLLSLTDATAGALQADTLSLPNLGFTLATAGRPQRHRRAVVAADPADASRALSEKTPVDVAGNVSAVAPVVFVFGGQAIDYGDFGAALHRTFAPFRSRFDAWCALAATVGAPDLREFMFERYPADPREMANDARFQPAVLVYHLALAEALRDGGLEAQALVGHSLGEYAAAAFSEALSVEEALSLAIARGEACRRVEPGKMLAVSLPVAKAERFCTGSIRVAGENAPDVTVLSGNVADIRELRRRLAEGRIAHLELPVDRPFHTPLMAPVAAAVSGVTARFRPRQPRIPYASSRTGNWVTLPELRDPDWWGAQVTEPVRFTRALQTVVAGRNALLLDLTPKKSFGALLFSQVGARRSFAVGKGRGGLDERGLLTAVTGLWAVGAEVVWERFFAGEGVSRGSLPPRPMRQEVCWLPAGAPPAVPRPVAGAFRCEVRNGLQASAVHLLAALAKTGPLDAVVRGPGFFPDREEWEDWQREEGPDDPLSLLIARLREVEAAGGTVRVEGSGGAPAPAPDIPGRHLVYFPPASVWAPGAGSNDLEERATDELRAFLARGTAERRFVLTAARGRNGGEVLFQVARTVIEAGPAVGPVTLLEVAAETAAGAAGWDAVAAAMQRARADDSLFSLVAVGESRPDGEIATAAGAAWQRTVKDEVVTDEADGDAGSFIIGLWNEAFGRNDIRENDDFFEIGGHSLLAVQTLSRLNERYGLDLQLSALFEHSRVEALAALVDEQRAAGDDLLTQLIAEVQAAGNDPQPDGSAAAGDGATTPVAPPER